MAPPPHPPGSPKSPRRNRVKANKLSVNILKKQNTYEVKRVYSSKL